MCSAINVFQNLQNNLLTSLLNMQVPTTYLSVLQLTMPQRTINKSLSNFKFGLETFSIRSCLKQLRRSCRSINYLKIIHSEAETERTQV